MSGGGVGVGAQNLENLRGFGGGNFYIVHGMGLQWLPLESKEKMTTGTAEGQGITESLGTHSRGLDYRGWDHF